MRIRKVAKDLSEGNKEEAVARNQTRNRPVDMFADLGGIGDGMGVGLGNMSRVQELDEDSDPEDEEMMDYEQPRVDEDSIIISPVTDVHPRQGRDDSNVYK
jgi:hypothetical protein